MALSIIQQHILSYFNVAKVTSLGTALKVFEVLLSVCGENLSPNKVELCKEISSVNSIIKKYDLEIVESIDEVKGNTVFVIINTVDNSITQKSKFYEKNTTQLFSKVVKDCVLSEKGLISEIHSLNLNCLIGISKTAAQAILTRLMKDKWIVSRNGFISLGMRSIIELEQNLKCLYPNEVQNCPLCKFIVIQGFFCNNCKVKSHFSCVTKYSTHTKVNCTCPNCKESWHDLSSQVKLEELEDIENHSEDQASVCVPVRKRKHFQIEK